MTFRNCRLNQPRDCGPWPWFTTALLLTGCCGLFTACHATPGNPGNAPASPAPAPPQAKLPANFPADIPLMPQLSLMPNAQSDPPRGTGRVTFAGPVKREAVVAYFDKVMKNEDWSEDESHASDGQWLMVFTKGRLKATLTVTSAGNTCTLHILYETQQ